MCDPTGLGFTIASMAASMAGAATNAIGSKQQADFQAKEARKAARREEIRAGQALDQAAQEQRKFDRQAAMLRGQQAASMAASGLDMGSGTLLDVFSDTAREQAIERQDLAYGGQLNAWNRHNQASSYRNMASNYKASGNNALAGGLLNATGSLLGKAGALKIPSSD